MFHHSFYISGQTMRYLGLDKINIPKFRFNVTNREFQGDNSGIKKKLRFPKKNFVPRKKQT